MLLDMKTSIQGKGCKKNTHASYDVEMTMLETQFEHVLKSQMVLRPTQGTAKKGTLHEERLGDPFKFTEDQ